MKASDRSILVGLLILVMLAGFWFLLLAPKRERASELEAQAESLRGEVAQQEQLALAAEQAQGDYAKNYRRLVVLGKAAPSDGDTPSLLAQLSELSKRSKTRFASLTLEASSGSAVPLPATVTETTTDESAEAGETAVDESVAPIAAATEASASLLPLGASVGPAGLGVMPYSLQFSGGFFEIADLLARLDDRVKVGARGAQVDGRLLTVSGFSMTRESEGEAELAVDLSITAYVLPESQGLTAGATPAAPPAEIPAAPQTTAAPAP